MNQTMHVVQRCLKTSPSYKGSHKKAANYAPITTNYTFQENAANVDQMFQDLSTSISGSTDILETPGTESFNSFS